MLHIDLKIPASLKRKLDPSHFLKAVQSGSLMVAKELEAQARPAPGPAKHPIEWASEKQRRAYFAMRRAGGWPAEYTRESDPQSERILESWVVDAVPPVSASLANSATYADWVIGAKQQPMHKNTGWKVLYDVAAKFFESGKAQKVFEKVLHSFFG